MSRAWRRLVAAWHDGRKAEIVISVVAGLAAWIIGIMLAVILVGCSTTPTNNMGPTTSSAPLAAIMTPGTGRVVAQSTIIYAERDITSAGVGALNYNDVFAVTACTWVMTDKPSPDQIWLTTDSGYVLSLDKATGQRNAVYALDLECEKVKQ